MLFFDHERGLPFSRSKKKKSKVYYISRMLKMTSVTNLSRSGVPHTKTFSSEIAFFSKPRNIAKFKLKASKRGF